LVECFILPVGQKLLKIHFKISQNFMFNFVSNFRKISSRQAVP